MLGIKNYSDESKISLCIYEGCQYEMAWLLEIHSDGSQILELWTYYEGGAKLNETQLITSVTLFYDKGVITHKFGTGIEISKDGYQKFTLKSADILEAQE